MKPPKKPPAKRHKRHRRLSADEAKLWRRAVQDVAPISKHDLFRDGDEAASDDAGARSGASSVIPVIPEDHPPPTLKSTAPSQLLAKNSGKKSGQNASRKNGKRAVPPILGAGDPGLDKRVAGGRLAIDRVLDLHGRTQALARPQLEAFLRAAHQDGCRCVLVITGKGGPASASNMAKARKNRHGQDPTMTDDRDEFSWSNDARPRGVLRAAAPQWIDASPVRALVSRMTPARPKDGGDGAFYVFLKARTKLK
ncbi:MAG: Smr/MutS family protein [Pseudomonadota bacterium]